MNTALSIRDTQQGLFWAALAVMSNVALDVTLKFTLGDLPPMQTIFLRWLFGALLLLPLALQFRWFEGFRLNSIYGTRMILNLIGTGSFIFSLSKLPLSLTVAIFFLEPLFSILFARLLFRERNSVQRYLAVAAGFAGVLLMLDFSHGVEPDLLAITAALLGTACWGLMNVLTRHYGQQQSSGALMFWLAALTAIGFAPVALWQWQPVTMDTALLLTIAALFGSLFNFGWTRAFKTLPVTLLAGVFNLYLPAAALLGWLWFGEVMTLQMLLGSAVVLLAVVLACKPERSRLARAE
ncbi:DMT family transporter [Marinobacterium jannaschii]|uniref:DMT family transporter n=1 Tax=Marinobacterium jannaschii TaxID=64970 RepID=UPI00048A1662|nr:DMT family transporter [Marinobacterium jannaschii]